MEDRQVKLELSSSKEELSGIKEEINTSDSEGQNDDKTLQIVYSSDEEDVAKEADSILGISDESAPIRIEINGSPCINNLIFVQPILNQTEENHVVVATDEKVSSTQIVDPTIYLPHPSLRRNLIPGHRKPRKKRSGVLKSDKAQISSSNRKPYEANHSFKCDKCLYSSDNSCNLRRHILVHKEEKPYACPLCDHRCNQKSNLQTHMITHTNFKPFQCNYCSFRSNLKGNIKKHELKNHL